MSEILKITTAKLLVNPLEELSQVTTIWLPRASTTKPGETTIYNETTQYSCETRFCLLELYFLKSHFGAVTINPVILMGLRTPNWGTLAYWISYHKEETGRTRKGTLTFPYPISLTQAIKFHVYVCSPYTQKKKTASSLKTKGYRKES